jgi:hypothetical protein
MWRSGSTLFRRIKLLAGTPFCELYKRKVKKRAAMQHARAQAEAFDRRLDMSALPEKLSDAGSDENKSLKFNLVDNELAASDPFQVDVEDIGKMEFAYEFDDPLTQELFGVFEVWDGVKEVVYRLYQKGLREQRGEYAKLTMLYLKDLCEQIYLPSLHARAGAYRGEPSANPAPWASEAERLARLLNVVRAWMLKREAFLESVGSSCKNSERRKNYRVLADTARLLGVSPTLVPAIPPLNIKSADQAVAALSPLPATAGTNETEKGAEPRPEKTEDTATVTTPAAQDKAKDMLAMRDAGDSDFEDPGCAEDDDEEENGNLSTVQRNQPLFAQSAEAEASNAQKSSRKTKKKAVHKHMGSKPAPSVYSMSSSVNQGSFLDVDLT